MVAGAQTAPAPTAQQVVEHSLRARGGAAKFAAVRSMHFTGTLALEKGSAGIEVWAMPRPYRIRVELQLPEGKFVQGYDGTTAWEIDPGKTQARVLAGTEATNVQDQALGFIDMMTAPDTQVALLGLVEESGRSCYKLRFTLPTGDSFVQYVDQRTWLVNHEEYPGGVEEISDYRRVDGLLLPFRYVSGPVGQPGAPLTRDKIELNLRVDPRLFVVPK